MKRLFASIVVLMMSLQTMTGMAQDPNDNHPAFGEIIVNKHRSKEIIDEYTRYNGQAAEKYTIDSATEVFFSNSFSWKKLLPNGNCTLVYRAKVKTKDLDGRVFLQMFCEFEGNPYFSKGLHQPLTGTNDWTELTIPFYLQEGQQPDLVELGINAQGKGTVWLADVKLFAEPAINLYHLRKNWHWIPGTLLGIFGGIYGALVGALAPRGKGRKLAMGLGIFAIAVCVIMFMTGFVFLLQNQPYQTWYSLLLPGALGAIIFGVLFPVVLQRYRESEHRKMLARDLE